MNSDWTTIFGTGVAILLIAIYMLCEGSISMIGFIMVLLSGGGLIVLSLSLRGKKKNDRRGNG